jgi:hypothetical protein
MSEKAKKVTSEANTASEALKAVFEPLTLEAYAKKAKVNIGFVASFKVEHPKEIKESHSEEDWKKAFEAQSKKAYK